MLRGRCDWLDGVLCSGSEGAVVGIAWQCSLYTWGFCHHCCRLHCAAGARAASDRRDPGRHLAVRAVRGGPARPGGTAGTWYCTCLRCCCYRCCGKGRGRMVLLLLIALSLYQPSSALFVPGSARAENAAPARRGAGQRAAHREPGGHGGSGGAMRWVGLGWVGWGLYRSVDGADEELIDQLCPLHAVSAWCTRALF